jgi:phosphate transport system substrate-binding protein
MERAALLLGMMLFAAAGPAAAQRSAEAAELRIEGSTTMAPLVKEIAARFASAYPRIRVDVRATGSARGIAAVRDATAEIGMASRALDETEAALFGFPVARDGAGVAVNAQNRVRNLSRRQLVDIFSGRIRNWRLVGGKDAPIVTITGGRAGGSTGSLLQAFDMPPADLKTDRELPSNQERVAALLREPSSIALLSVGAAERLSQAGLPIRLLAVDGIEVSRRAIMSGGYPASRPLLLVTRSLARGAAKLFIEYATSAQVADLVEKYDFMAYRE